MSVIFELLWTLLGMAGCVLGFFLVMLVLGKVSGTWDDDENIRGYGP